MKKTPLHQRDLSWLSFNERVLQEAENICNPLYERIKFLAIFSANLDEFYKVRMSDLRKYKSLKKKLRPKDAEKPKRIVKQILKIINAQQNRYGVILNNQVFPELKTYGIELLRPKSLNKTQQQFSKAYFEDHIKSLISVCDLEKNPPFLVDKTLYLLFETEQAVKLVNIPADVLPRFVALPSPKNKFCYIFIDDILRHNLYDFLEEQLVKNQEFYAIKLTRDAELYLDEEDYSQQVIDQIKANLPNRKDGLPTRLLYDSRINPKLLKRIQHGFDLNKLDLVLGGRYHNLHDFFVFPEPVKSKNLFFEPQPPLDHPKLTDTTDLLTYFSNHSEIISFPYQKFDAVVQLIQQAAQSERVETISITLYRVSKNSAIAKALLLARAHNKKVSVFIEAKARFDEENNIFWGEQLQAAGAKVLYSKPNLKVHSKIFLIEGPQLQISHIGTGNFNENNAKIYTDFAYITPDKTIAEDLTQVFKYLNEEISKPIVNRIWLSPFYLRTQLEQAISGEIENHKAGKKAFIKLKLNALQDESLIALLYNAALAGVIIQLIIRGICCLKFNQPGMESLKGIAIVGRYLEHNRIYWFANNGNDKVVIASADGMSRNLTRRIEVGIDIQNIEHQNLLKNYFKIQWKDQQKARILDAELTNTIRDDSKNGYNSQNELYHYFKKQLVTNKDNSIRT